MKGFNKRLICLLVNKSLPTSLIESEEFRDMINFIDVKVKISCSKTLSNKFSEFYFKMREEIISKIENAVFLNFM